MAASTLTHSACGAITNMYNSFAYNMATAMIMQPVFPLHDPVIVTEFTVSSIPFDDTLKNIFDESVCWTLFT